MVGAGVVGAGVLGTGADGGSGGWSDGVTGSSGGTVLVLAPSVVVGTPVVVGAVVVGAGVDVPGGSARPEPVRVAGGPPLGLVVTGAALPGE
ncbi:hypothetical protein ACFS2C_12500 [Prauserella oleivorans]|uniref:Uncharacterized protein n=1 Tax=Prauserella oleivorans TaxID=1478153 RepID=A0ABW5W8C6_9PSEU